ncbi:unnamed protein product [Penicillium salamii]|uniref:Uncharacterized protein n=1 Tax=Penicillium salamii TaxID=1612424 RepID=A0A9W4IV17_9EURO|nr:unnamed protein product [Penicillium salamii]CAG8120863.1 unnamed protein product [Penicillium salamii]CAG8290979.1 unnamed protein product [Penicillium salamii]CAG8343117.1 unnamed protein product [Penicillium salamii]CAG8344972.1 unnamed protein product [Penicillium salamii]
MHHAQLVSLRVDLTGKAQFTHILSNAPLKRALDRAIACCGSYSAPFYASIGRCLASPIQIISPFLPFEASWCSAIGIMKRPISERLQLVSFPEGGGFLPTPAEGLDPDLRIGDRQKYIAGLNKESSFWPAGCVEASCPHPLLITEKHQETFEKLAEALDLVIQDIVERWWTDEEAGFPLRMPLEPREEILLRWIDGNRDICRPYSERKGSWRPDFVIENDETGAENFRICEINARFCWNGFMLIRGGQKGLSTFDVESRGLIRATDPDTVSSTLKKNIYSIDKSLTFHQLKIASSLLGLFDPGQPLHLVKGKEHGYDIYMFMELAKKLGLNLRLIHPDDLRILPDEAGVNGSKLCCLASTEATESFPSGTGEIVEDVNQICLELHQSEFRSLGSEMQKQISVRCFNDLRTMLLVHDKRMLGIIREELGSLKSRGVISIDQANRLANGIAHTVLPGSSTLFALEQQSHFSESLKNDYLLKPTRGGKGAGILFGDEISNSDWLAILQTMKSPQIHEKQTSYVLQRKVCQPFYDIFLGSDATPSRCHMVGTFHMVHGKFLGLGIWRCSTGRLCAISTGGASWMVSVMQRPVSGGIL